MATGTTAGVKRADFGRTADGTPVEIFTLTNAHGLSAKITKYGTIITELHVPDRNGKFGDVVLGFDNLEQYLKGHPFFGAVAGRVANRIAGAQFELDGKTYKLAANNGPNSLHGGKKGFDKYVWKAEPQAGAAVKFTHSSPDGDEGYPGKVDVTMVMSLTDANELTIDYTAVTDAPTPINLTNHSYFNLACGGDILKHELRLVADQYTPAGPGLIPTGEIRSVKGTPFDFTTAQPIGARLAEIGAEPPGYDTNFVLRPGGPGPRLAARVREPGSGRVLEVLTTEPAVQFYTGNFLNGSVTGKGGTAYGRHSGFCLETQHFPDSVHHANFPSTILRPGQTYRQTTVHRFSTE